MMSSRPPISMVWVRVVGDNLGMDERAYLRNRRGCPLVLRLPWRFGTRIGSRPSPPCAQHHSCPFRPSHPPRCPRNHSCCGLSGAGLRRLLSVLAHVVPSPDPLLMGSRRVCGGRGSIPRHSIEMVSTAMQSGALRACEAAMVTEINVRQRQ